MSTRIRRRFPQVLPPTFLLLVPVFLLAVPTARAQINTISIRVVTGAPSYLVVDAECAPTSVWFFRDSYAGMLGLGDRVAELKAFTANGAEIPVRRIAPGQYESSNAATRFSYRLNTAPPLSPLDAAKVSWVIEQHGLLTLRDVLPATTVSNPRSGAATPKGHLRLKLDLPQAWSAYSSERFNGASEFEFNDYDVAVIAIGVNLRVSTRRVSDTALTLITDGLWSFTDAEAAELAGKVYGAQRAIFGSSPSPNIMLTLFQFPRPTSPNMWTAETRGSSVTLLSGNLPSKVGALAQLSTPLTHELFHLWVPNSLALDGDYDWFYEGFTVYEAARTAVRLDLLTFQEFLNAIGRAYDGYLANADRDRWSLVEASKRRWSAGPSAVYSESMIIAFLYDLRLRLQTRGKRSIENIYPALVKNYGAHANILRQAADGNVAAMSVLESEDATGAFVRTFITAPAKIDLLQELAPFGLKVETLGLRTRVSVSDQLTKQQRELLRQLGYNEVTRDRRGRKN